MEYSVFEDLEVFGDWRVEAINHAGDGEIEVTIFSGPRAQERAREYYEWKVRALATI
jgi:hypothetical protein